MQKLAFLHLFFISLSFSLNAQVNTSDIPSNLNNDIYFVPRKVNEIKLPLDYERVETELGSFQAYLQYFPLKEDTTVYLHNGEKKEDQSFAYKILDIDVGKKNLQQCADAVIRLRAEYLFHKKDYEKIHFNFTSGDKASYLEWRDGYRPIVLGNKVSWEKKASFDNSYQNFRNYLNKVFNYAGSWSLERELKTVFDTKSIQIGDMLVRGAFPGHIMLVVDVAKNPKTEDIIFLLAQSARPAQDVHIVKNRNNLDLSPWYNIKDLNSKLTIEEWTFYKENLMRF